MHVAALRVSLVKSVKRLPVMSQQQQSQQQVPGKCQYWVEKKRRFCKMGAMPGHKFCGNHFDCSAEGGGPRRIVCPFDPTGGHTVLESELEKHKPRCPAYKQMLEQKAQPFYKEGINEGHGPEACVPQAPQEFADRKGRTDSTAARRAALAAAMGPERFARLLARIEQAYQQICGEPDAVSVLCPPQAVPYMKEDGLRPFSLKHATQQASIIGNMEQEGLLEDTAGTTYLEFGAGKGFLSAMLADCTGARKLVMLDVRGFKGKADRVMRHLTMQRLRCDIKDFDLRGVQGLGSGVEPWVGIGKHLCGAATDFTLRCCARERQAGAGGGGEGTCQLEQQAQRQEQGQEQGQQQGTEDVIAAAAAATLPGEELSPAAVVAAAAAASDAHVTSNAFWEGAAERPATGAAAAGAVASRRGLQGLAIATCCHHRCSWRHYVGQEAFVQAGFSPEEFEVVSWMTGWALCGHEAPAGFGSEAMSEDDEDAGGEAGSRDGARQPAAAATAGNASAEVGAAVAVPGPAAWAGEGAARGNGGGDDGGDSSSKGGEQGPAKRRHMEPLTQGMAAEGGGLSGRSEGQQQQQQSVGEAGATAQQASAAGGAAAQQDGGGAGPGTWWPHHSLSRAERIAVGQKCKRLIDSGRLQWLLRQGFQARFVTYVAPEVSGENQLLLASAALGCAR